MSKNLERVVYRSRSTLHPDNVEELDKVFRTSIVNNRRDHVTGCLAHPDGHFVQVIEGTSKGVTSLLDRLAIDTRHTDLIVLGRWLTPSRLFSTWAMARPDITPLADQSFHLIDQTGSGAQVTGILLTLVMNGTTLYDFGV